MTYSAAANAGEPRFDNVFVTPQAYQAFLKTGVFAQQTWWYLQASGRRDGFGVQYQNSDFKAGKLNSAGFLPCDAHRNSSPGTCTSSV